MKIFLCVLAIMFALFGGMCSCGYLLNGLQGGTSSIEHGAWEWGDINHGSKLICNVTQDKRVFAFDGGRLFDPYGTVSYGTPNLIRKGEIFTVLQLDQYSTGSYSNYNLKLRDQLGKPVILSVSGSNRQSGSAFSEARLARVGLQPMK